MNKSGCLVHNHNNHNVPKLLILNDWNDWRKKVQFISLVWWSQTISVCWLFGGWVAATKSGDQTFNVEAGLYRSSLEAPEAFQAEYEATSGHDDHDVPPKEGQVLSLEMLTLGMKIVYDTQLELQLTSLETIMTYMTSLTWLGLNEQSAVNPSKPLGSWSWGVGMMVTLEPAWGNHPRDDFHFDFEHQQWEAPKNIQKELAQAGTFLVLSLLFTFF